jgi:2-keto-4-pentenoate hydratase/2-oxohepta-3-ene-1,7-dioic acid hydratase in catechol pathway
MKLICFEQKGIRSVGVLEGNIVADLGQLLCEVGDVEEMVGDILPLIQAGISERLASFDVTAVLAAGRFVKDISQVAVCVPLSRPPKIVCVGGNYGAHLKESERSGKDRNVFSSGDGTSKPKPVLFAKPPNCVIGPGEKIIIPEESNEVDYEVELGVIIGKPGYRLSPEQAREHIFGYTILNDVTARDLQRSDGQWYRAKGFATFAPLGPAVVTADDIDPENVGVRLTVNGEVRQQSNTSDMIWNVYELVAMVSAVTPLEAGDLIGTGTPEGVGGFMDPPVYLKPGDIVAATIDGIGTLENEVTRS